MFRTNTVFEVSAPVAATLKSLEDINAAIPSPYQMPVSLGLGVLSGVLGLIARKASADKAETTKALESVVLGVERAANPETKKAIRETSRITGAEWTVSAVVERLTG